MKTIILIDSGNTRLKVGVVEGAGDANLHAHALDNDDIRGLKNWLATLSGAPVAALGTNVAGPARAAAIEAALGDIHCPVRWIVPQVHAYGLTSRYTQPEQLGADRWVSMLGVLARRDAVKNGASEASRLSGASLSGASHASDAAAAGSGNAEHGMKGRPTAASPASPYPAPPFLLASFGTATTLDTVSGDNVFEGGLILPGAALMRDSLASGTANLPLAHGDAMAYPTDTRHAIASGIAAAQAGAVLRQWLGGLRRYGDAPHIYAAGGGWPEVEAETRRLLADAAAAMGRLPPIISVIENPVLHGLARIAATANLDQT